MEHGAPDALAAFKRYTQAFQSLDARGCARCFHLPALMASPKGVFAFTDPGAVEQAYQGVMAELPGMGYARSDFPELSAHPLGGELAVVTGRCIWKRADDMELRGFDIAYTLRRTREGWKILTALIA